MFNKSMEEQKKELNKYKKELKKIVSDADIGELDEFEQTRNGVKYHCQPAWKLVVDDYDPVIGSIELSHRETKGYSVVDSYCCPDKRTVSELDFTFAKPQDVINVKLDDNIKKVKINATNLRYTKLEGKHTVFVNVVVNTGTVDTLLGLKRFIKGNRNIIRDVTLLNSGRMLESALEKMLEKPVPDKEISRGK